MSSLKDVCIGDKNLIPTVEEARRIEEKYKKWCEENSRYTPYAVHEPDPCKDCPGEEKGCLKRCPHQYRHGYKRGYQDGMQDLSVQQVNEVKVAKSYRSGLDDAWNCAKKILNMSIHKRQNIFNSASLDDICKEYSPLEVMEIIENCEKKNAKTPCSLCRFREDNSGLCDMCPAMPVKKENK